MSQHVVDVIAGGVGAGPNSNYVLWVRYDSSVFQRRPRDLQHHALLRINHLGCLRHDLEKVRVKFIGAFENTTRGNVVGVSCISGVQCRVKFFGREERDRFAAFNKVVPVLCEIVSTRKTSRHADDGVLASVFV